LRRMVSDRVSMRAAYLAAVVVLAGCARLDPPPVGTARTAAEEAVAEAVFRHMLIANHDWSPRPSTACLTVRGRDAAATTLAALVGNGPVVKRGSACAWQARSRVIDLENGEDAILLTVAFFDWHTGSHVTVESTYEEANLSAGGYGYDLVHRGGTWVVRRFRTKWIA
jgi:hypothetical protein